MTAPIRTPDQRLRVFVSSTLEELRAEREAAREAIESLRLTPVMFELGARPHPPAEVYRSYLDQSDVFVGIYGERYGWIGPGMEISGLEDELRRATAKPRLVYVKEPAPGRDERLSALIAELMRDAAVSFKTFATASDVRDLLRDDLAVLLTERFASGAAAPAARARLPTPLDEFVGRERELAALTELVTGRARLVTVTGPGGVGKTRLALEASRRASDAFADDASFVSLDAVTEPELVVPTIVSSLALPADASAPPLELLLDDLRTKHLLLVLDNFEHVLAASPIVADVLAACPEVVVLATSRAVLRLRGEYEVPLEPLDVPTDGVRLFVERARQVDATFELTDENAGPVTSICARLEGLPLAVELAAARVRLFSPASLLERLEAGTELLEDGPRDLPERQQTLRSAIDWSFELLDDAEQRLFVRSGVFRGSWSLEAAEAVCRTDGEIAPQLEALLEHSLVKRDRRSTLPRYSMLETIRAYASERLAATGEANDIGRRHARFYLELADVEGRRLRSASQWAALERLDLEIDNLRAAFTWCLTSGDADSVAAATASLMHFWWLRGHIDEGTRWADAVVADPGISSEGRAHALLLKGSLRFWRGDQAGAAPLAAEAVDLLAGAGDMRGAAFARVILAATRAGAGDRSAIDELEETRTILAASGDEYDALLATNGLCWASTRLGVDAPLELFEGAVAAAQALGVEAELATARGNLGSMRMLRGELDEATNELREALRIAMRLRSRTGTAHYVARIAELCARSGDSETSVRLATAAAAIAEPASGGTALAREDAAAEALAWADRRLAAP